ncbi:MAG: class I adenylate-forming enzyme family protein [Bryobacteraceae bacterium]
MNLFHLFDLSLHGRANEPALEWSAGTGIRVSTFSEIEERSNRLAWVLEARGLRTGDRLCVYLRNRSEFIDLYLASLKLGVIFVPVNILYRERELSHIISDVEPRAIVVAEHLSVSCPVWKLEELISAASSSKTSRPLKDIDGDTPALIIYTSGTTGPAKGAVLTHNNLAANTLALLTLWQITASDRFLLSLPLFHVHGLGFGVHCWLASGCVTRLLERLDPVTAEQTFLHFRPTLFFGVPTIYVRLLQMTPDAAAEIGRSMRLFVSGSAPLSTQVFEEFQAKFGHTILERYGMSETLVNTSNPYLGERRPGSVGLPLAGVSVRLLDNEGRPVKDGDVGQVHIRGANVFKEYWRNEEATKNAFSNGYFRTGDLGVRSGGGYYELRGRASDLIISGGYNIYPREIEEFLQLQPEIAEAAVIGVPDPVWGEVPVAYVVSTQSFDPADIQLRCKASLASFKMPQSILIVDALPRNAMGKIAKKQLASSYDRTQRP